MRKRSREHDRNVVVWVSSSSISALFHDRREDGDDLRGFGNECRDPIRSHEAGKDAQPVSRLPGFLEGDAAFRNEVRPALRCVSLLEVCADRASSGCGLTTGTSKGGVCLVHNPVKLEDRTSELECPLPDVRTFSSLHEVPPPLLPLIDLCRLLSLSIFNFQFSIQPTAGAAATSGSHPTTALPVPITVQ